MNARQIMFRISISILMIFTFTGIAVAGMETPLNPKDGFDLSQVERGRYILKTSGCNDCHTPQYTMVDGNVAEEGWLTGDAFGWRGPWGTTYGANLRIFINALTENQWVDLAHVLKTRPPMPWFNLNAMHDEDLEAVYQFMKYLGPGGEPAPAYVPPGEEPKTPFALFPAPPQ